MKEIAITTRDRQPTATQPVKDDLEVIQDDVEIAVDAGISPDSIDPIDPTPH